MLHNLVNHLNLETAQPRARARAHSPQPTARAHSPSPSAAFFPFKSLPYSHILTKSLPYAAVFPQNSRKSPKSLPYAHILTKSLPYAAFFPQNSRKSPKSLSYAHVLTKSLPYAASTSSSQLSCCIPYCTLQTRKLHIICERFEIHRNRPFATSLSLTLIDKLRSTSIS